MFFYLIDHKFYKFSDIQSTKIFFEPAKHVCSMIRLNDTNQNNTFIYNVIKFKKIHDT